MASTDPEEVRQRIIASALERRNTVGGPPERYVAHLSGMEDGEDGLPKLRYIILSGARPLPNPLYPISPNPGYSLASSYELRHRVYTQVQSEHERNVFHRQDLELVRTARNRSERTQLCHRARLHPTIPLLIRSPIVRGRMRYRSLTLACL